MIKIKAVLLRRWPVLVAATLIGLAAGVFSALLAGSDAAKDYSAAQVLVANEVADGPAFVPQDALKVTRGEVPAAAAKALRWDGSVESLAARVTAEADADSNSITVTASDPDPDRSLDIVQAFTASFLEIVNADLLSEDQKALDDAKATVDQAEAELATFDAQHPEISRTDIPLADSPAVSALIAERRRLTEDITTVRQQYDTARLALGQRQPYSSLGPEAPTLARGDLLKVPTSPVFRGGLLGLLGLLLGAGLVFALERTNPRVDTSEELHHLVTVPVIAEVPALPRKGGQPVGPRGEVLLQGPQAEHYRRVRSTIQFIQNQQAPHATLNGHGAAANGNGNGTAYGAAPERSDRVFLFTSAMPNEGKSTSSTLTALALAEAGRDTLIVDGDFRKPSLVQMLGVAPTPSLDDLARAGVTRPNIHATVQACGVPHLWAAVGGLPGSVVFHRLVAAQAVIAEASSRDGTVIIDSAPLGSTNDTVDLLPVVDHVFLVVRAGRTTQSAVTESVELLSTYGASLVGIVFVGSTDTRNRDDYYYGTTNELPAGPSKGFRVVESGLPQGSQVQA